MTNDDDPGESDKNRLVNGPALLIKPTPDENGPRKSEDAGKGKAMSGKGKDNKQAGSFPQKGRGTGKKGGKRGPGGPGDGGDDPGDDPGAFPSAWPEFSSAAWQFLDSIDMVEESKKSYPTLRKVPPKHMRAVASRIALLASVAMFAPDPVSKERALKMFFLFPRIVG